ncbi:glutamate--tRNA ligase [Euzebya tangerina]|uniref:glutamate--tRNA ligase n=1 Tax=Euzebya tangerina TaxID=591198 RepID=UPI000E323CB9|nr:glutamate--tRNA ligase family protein [Euzebya tangerina]
MPQSTSSTPPRLRFCPAPSGWLHVGSARAALFNWLVARRDGGAFVLRIEDTDAERATMESAVGMMEGLAWLGLEWDEGPAIGRFEQRGALGPYLQSQRRDLHESVVRLLLRDGHAYEAFETAEELQAQREAAGGGARGGVYKTGHRDLTEEQRQALRDEGRTPVIRVRTPDAGTVSFDDHVRGEVSFEWDQIGDFVISRADGSPTYMLANIVDDLAQGISLVARGEDLLSATPRQVLMTQVLLDTGILAEALDQVGYPVRPDGAPDRLTYAHLPLLIGEDKKKLSKRHGDVSLESYARAGIIPEAMVNFLALCGWSAGDDREEYPVDELIEAFSLDRVNPAPAVFDNTKLRSMNGSAIRALEPEDLAERLVPAFQRAELVGDPVDPSDRDLIRGFAPLVQQRIDTLDDAPPFVSFAFADEIEWDEKAVKKWLKPAAGPVLDRITPALAGLDAWTAESIMPVFEEAKEALDLGMGKVMQPVRVLVTGTAVSPPLPETLELLDQQWVVDRLVSGRDRVAAPAD